MDQAELQRIKQEFQPVWNEINPLAILLFGSQATNNGYTRSDTDICIVLGEKNSDHETILSRIWRRVGGKYDLWLFEELPIKIQYQIINQYQIIYCDDEPLLGEYFRPFRKSGEDYIHRLKVAYGRI